MGYEISLAIRLRRIPRIMISGAKLQPGKEQVPFGIKAVIYIWSLGKWAVLQEYFSNVFANEKDMEDNEFCEGYVDSLKKVSIKKMEVLDIMEGTKIGKSSGLENLSQAASESKRGDS